MHLQDCPASSPSRSTAQNTTSAPGTRLTWRSTWPGAQPRLTRPDTTSEARASGATAEKDAQCPRTPGTPPSLHQVGPKQLFKPAHFLEARACSRSASASGLVSLLTDGDWKPTPGSPSHKQVLELSDDWSRSYWLKQSRVVSVANHFAWLHCRVKTLPLMFGELIFFS